MPSRILREGITSSDTIDCLTAEEEVFFYRLLTVCDDYGLMDARPAILLAKCFPLKKYTDKLILRWLNGLAASGLVRVYAVSDKPYLAIIQWDQHQRVRNARHKYPLPQNEQVAAILDNSRQVAATCGDSRQVAPRARTDTPAESESESNPDGGICRAAPDVDPLAKPSTPKTEALAILAFLNAKASRAYQPVAANLDFIVARLKEGATPAQCRQVIAKKVREWLGDEKMAEYLRPATLFNATKFAQYVGELVP